VDWLSKINVGSLSSDQWIARGTSAAGLVVAAVASAFRFDRPIVATLLLTVGSLLFIFALWIAARNRVRWLESAVVILCLILIALCTYRVTQQRKIVPPTAANSGESANPDSNRDAQ
jgi:hypothetical protein